MNFGVIAVMLSLELSIALACNASDTTASERQRAPYTRLAQASPDAAGATTNNLQGIGLTASHKRIIYDNIASEQAQTVSGDLRLAVGSTIPDSLMLNSMPIAVEDQSAVLFKGPVFTPIADICSAKSMSALCQERTSWCLAVVSMSSMGCVQRAWLIMLPAADHAGNRRAENGRQPEQPELNVGGLEAALRPKAQW